MINKFKAVILFAAGMILAALSLSSCSSAKKIATVTEYRDHVTRDTVERVDSVYVSRLIRERGDTVYITDTLIRFAYRDRVKLEYIHDSIPYVQEVQVPVRERNGYDRFTSWGFWILVILLLLRLAWWAFKTFYLRR